MKPQARGNKEIVIAFRPDFFATYVEQLEALHGSGRGKTDFRTLEQISQTSDLVVDIPPGPRRTVLQEVQRRIRDARFRKNVISAYGHRCAMSDIQLDLLDAAHIVPVEHDKGTDEMKNGICLSAIHHRAFDRGLVGIRTDYAIVLNERKLAELDSIGWSGGADKFRATLRDHINLPSRSELYPDPKYLVLGQTLRGWLPKEIT